MIFEPGMRVGKYEIGRKLGEGGFGVLYVARDTELGRDVAIKILRPEHAFRSEILQRFLQEARAAARINHPGIVTVFESGAVSGTNTRADGTVFIAMELLAGDTLSQRIKRVGRFPLATALGVARQIAAALAAAHAAGIVHRDLKPQNVFLVPDAAVIGGDRVKVLDFGIAKLMDGFGSNIQTHSMTMLGTPMYMSPEQCKSSAKVDARSDVYSLGCILFQLVCGKPPFDGDSGELIAKHQLVAPPQPRSLIGELPETVDALIAAMLAKSPSERPQTMEAIVDLLDACVSEDEPTTQPVALGAPEAGQEPAQDLATTLGASAMAHATTPRSTAWRNLALGASAAIAAGVLLGVCATRGSSNEPAAPAVTRPIDAAASALASPPPPPTPDAAVVAQVPTPDAAPAAPDEGPALPIPTESTGKAAPVRHAKAATTARPQPTREPEAKTEPPAPANCDADALQQKGEDQNSLGQYAAALFAFEAALKCKPDGHLVELAFMAACNAKNVPKARTYYGRLAAEKQAKLGQICVRNRITLELLER